jgi:hypothetical protein
MAVVSTSVAATKWLDGAMTRLQGPRLASDPGHVPRERLGSESPEIFERAVEEVLTEVEEAGP